MLDPTKQKRKQLAEGPRQQYSHEFKLQVLQETFAPGASVASVACRHDMNTNVVFRWRKLYREGRLVDDVPAVNALLPPGSVPVCVTDNEPAPPASPPPEKPVRRKKPGVVAIRLPGGFALRVDADIDMVTLRRMLKAVRELS